MSTSTPQPLTKATVRKYRFHDRTYCKCIEHQNRLWVIDNFSQQDGIGSGLISSYPLDPVFLDNEYRPKVLFDAEFVSPVGFPLHLGELAYAVHITIIKEVKND